MAIKNFVYKIDVVLSLIKEYKLSEFEDDAKTLTEYKSAIKYGDKQFDYSEIEYNLSTIEHAVLDRVCWKDIKKSHPNILRELSMVASNSEIDLALSIGKMMDEPYWEILDTIELYMQKLGIKSTTSNVLLNHTINTDNLILENISHMDEINEHLGTKYNKHAIAIIIGAMLDCIAKEISELEKQSSLKQHFSQFVIRSALRIDKTIPMNDTFNKLSMHNNIDSYLVIIRIDKLIELMRLDGRNKEIWQYKGSLTDSLIETLNSKLSINDNMLKKMKLLQAEDYLGFDKISLAILDAIRQYIIELKDNINKDKPDQKIYIT